MFYVYILGGEKYYVGYTSDLDQRMIRHAQGNTQTTRNNKNTILIGYFVCETKTQAILLEKRIKKSGHIQRRLEKDGFIQMNKNIL